MPTKAVLIALILGSSAPGPLLAGPLARFSYSVELAAAMNLRYGPPGGMNPAAPRFVVDETRGRDTAGPLLLGAIQALIRAFPGCGNRQLPFAYAYGEAADERIVVFNQKTMHAPECPAIAAVAVSTASAAVTVRSFPEL